MTGRRTAQLAKRLDPRVRRYARAATLRARGVAHGPGVRWYQRGLALEELGHWIGAAHAYQAAVARNPRRPEWHFRLGRALEESGQHGAARVAHKHAEALDPLPPSRKGVEGRQLPYRRRVDLGLMPRPQYAYCLHRAALLAQRLGIPRISAVELGVAGGNGLLAMERHAASNEAMTGVAIDVYGFDTGHGLVAPADHRDLPYRFAEGNYAMDEAALRARLERAELVIGDATETFRDFLDADPAPIGVVSFDMDLYSPTIRVLQMTGDGADESRFLPRVRMYFDDVVGKGDQDYNAFTGELLAIDEFNTGNKAVKVAEDRYFRSLPLNLPWHHGMYAQHRFEHPEYDTYVHSADAGSLSLKGDRGRDR